MELLKAADHAYSQAATVRPMYTVAINNHGLALVRFAMSFHHFCCLLYVCLIQSTLAKWTRNEAMSDELFERAYALFARIAEPLSPSTYHCQVRAAIRHVTCQN